ncbi:helix-turn-helix transcriptional regulator [Maribacter sp. MMG018]|uniref:AraC family transcriptional regulator n=1 Tax=Maribacter sp. MMG018 TaxID=2822688 RepID=UPI001B39A1AC|nr:AraC family transcriptional regulator [Maribacter sp. MMG018]MBQ4912888.1 helix-turn-helix transcriptional regulator [Maribacter sp. MMG018]
MFFDNLEYINIDGQTANFPKHFHETFCISLIHQGIEQIEFENQSFFSEKGSISITNPYEIHANPLSESKVALKFDTIYLSGDLMKYLFEGKNITFENRKINSEKANLLFVQLTKAMDTGNAKTIELALHRFANAIKYHSQENIGTHGKPHFSDFNEIDLYIENNIHEKFNLDDLSRMANINKYGFVKKFKATTGMTPMNYILMKKVFSCKELIDAHTELTDVAYRYNFTDMAHFSKTFKRFVGVSPKKYQTHLIEIL